MLYVKLEQQGTKSDEGIFQELHRFYITFSKILYYHCDSIITYYNLCLNFMIFVFLKF